MGNDIFANNSPNLKKHLMKTFWSCLIFLLALASFPAEAQTGKPLKKTLWVVKDSGSVVFSPYDLIDDESLIPKNFGAILVVKPMAENVSVFMKKHSMKPHMRIESNIGRLSFFGSGQALLKINSDSICPSFLKRYRAYKPIVPNQLYPDRDGMSIFCCVVSGIDKKARTLKVTIYDNLNDKIIGERVFELSPTVVHYYTTELHYTDMSGNPQVHTNRTKNWIPADTTVSAKVVVKDEYGATVPIKKFKVWYSGSMGNTLTPMYEGDEWPFTSRTMSFINQRGRRNETYVITPDINVSLERCDYVKSLVIGE